jgi:hypothetical protein
MLVNSAIYEGQIYKDFFGLGQQLDIKIVGALSLHPLFRKTKKKTTLLKKCKL